MDPNEALESFCAITGPVQLSTAVPLTAGTGVDDMGVAMSMLEGNNWNLGITPPMCLWH